MPRLSPRATWRACKPSSKDVAINCFSDPEGRWIAVRTVADDYLALERVVLLTSWNHAEDLRAMEPIALIHWWSRFWVSAYAPNPMGRIIPPCSF